MQGVATWGSLPPLLESGEWPHFWPVIPLKMPNFSGPVGFKGFTTGPAPPPHFDSAPNSKICGDALDKMILIY